MKFNNPTSSSSTFPVPESQVAVTAIFLSFGNHYQPGFNKSFDTFETINQLFNCGSWRNGADNDLHISYRGN